MERVEMEAKKVRKPGRPRAIPAELERVVVELYREGYGYRAIARILREEYSLNPHYSSIRKTLIRLGEVKDKNRHENLS
jgi:transposase